MKVVIQRVTKANVKIDNKIVGNINKGLVVLVGFTHNDSELDIDYIVNKIINLRIFDDENGIMNICIKDINGSILSISQFTLYANTNKGNRPNYIDSLNSNEAKPLYNLFNDKLKLNNINVEQGIFGSEMEVELVNDGPVTIIIDSKK
jgi:D-aminoacyl-tRNA deacylase